MSTNQNSPAPMEIGLEHIQSIRRLIHRKLIESLELEGTDLLSDEKRVRRFVAGMLSEIELEKNSTISPSIRLQIERETLEELGGYGPLAQLMVDDEISDILVNAADEVWVDRNGQLQRTEVRFDDEAHLRRILDRLVASQGRHLDASSPMVDARLPDGSRLHAVVPPLCTSGAVISIRKFRVKPFKPEELIDSGFLNQNIMDFLEETVKSRVNIIISGGASAGKTTLLNLISRFIPEGERIVTIEETSELRLEHSHTITLEGRASNPEGFGAIDLRKLVKTALRMRADRIIIGEVRGDEVLDMLQAMNVGHDGSLTTVHANSPEDVIGRLETLAMMSGDSVPRSAIRDMIGAAIHVIVHLVRFSDGTRRISSIRKLSYCNGEISTKELFRFSPAQFSDNNSTDNWKYFNASSSSNAGTRQAGYKLQTSETKDALINQEPTQ